MTLKEFKNIKENDTCYLRQKDGKYLSTVVLNKDNLSYHIDLNSKNLEIYKGIEI